MELPTRAHTLHPGLVGASRESSTPKLSTFAVQNLQDLAANMPCTELVIMLQVPYFILKMFERFFTWASVATSRTRARYPGNDCSVGQLLTPVGLWTSIAVIFLLFGLTWVLVVIYFLLKALQLGAKNVWPQLIGVLFAFSGMLMEMLVVYRVIDYLPINVSGYGSAIWISLQLTAQRFAGASNNRSICRPLQDKVQKQTETLRGMNCYPAENVLRWVLPSTVVADIVAGSLLMSVTSGISVRSQRRANTV